MLFSAVIKIPRFSSIIPKYAESLSYSERKTLRSIAKISLTGRHSTLPSRIAHNGLHAETGGDYRSTILTAYSLCSLPALQLRDQKAHLPRTVRAGAKEKANQKGNSLTHNGCAFAAHVRCVQAPRARRHAQPRCFFSLHRGTPRFWPTVITECGKKHTSFLCAELLCQLCLRLPPLCCTL